MKKKLLLPFGLAVVTLRLHAIDPAKDKAAFEQAATGPWREVFADAGMGDWKQRWFLDGEVGTVKTGPDGMELTAGPEFKNDAHHIVLWTKESFEGDLKIEYDYTRLDQATNCVTILYLQATGNGEAPYLKDITAWNALRKVPSMATYFDNMNTYHISYASFMNSHTQSYIRGRRYMPHHTGLKGSDLKPDYIVEGLFATGVKHHITVLKKERALFMRIENPDGIFHYPMHNTELPIITEGRIGLRHMFTRAARYQNFRISVPTSDVEAGKPLVRAKIITNWNKRGDFTRHYNQSILAFAGRVLALNEQQHLAEANAALREMCQYHLDRPQTFFEIHSFPSAVNILASLYLYYGTSGNKAPGRLSAETCEIVEKTLWEWAREKSKLADAEVEQSQTWWVNDSENHHAFHFSTCWKLAGILKELPRYKDNFFKDGETPARHHAAWTTYAKEYIRQRACKGMLVEIDSPSYTTATLGCVGNFYEFSDDPVLKRRAGLFMELYWALVAEEQFKGATGGAQTRSYAKHTVHGSSALTGLAGTVLGLGGAREPSYWESSWAAPDVVLRIAQGWQEKAPYEIRQRRMGLAMPGYDRPPNYRLRTDFGGLLRYTWCTPDFIMGSFMHEARPVEDWTAISSQNRWSGVSFAGDPGARVFAAPYSATGASILNGFWSVQSKGTLISQQLPSRKKGEPIAGEGTSQGWRVFFSNEGLSEPVTNNGWLFAEAKSAYVGVRVLSGETSFEKQSFGRWLVCQDALSPVIIEAGQKSDYQDFASFQKAVLAQTISFEKSVVSYASLGGDKLTFYADRSRLPEINGHALDLAPAKVYDSPFVQSKWDSGVVTLSCGGETRILDFNR